VLGERLANPDILAVVCADKQDQVVPGSVVRMKEVCDDAQKAEASCEQNQLIFVAQLSEDVLLEFL
jgi:hypothetical protein